MRISELLERLGERVALDKAAGWDPVGLQIGDPNAPARKVGLCHEVTEAVTQAVLRDPVDLLLSYHPLLFRPLRALVLGPTPAGRAYRIARAGAALAVVHTAFDVCPGGGSDALAEALGLSDLRGFGPLYGPDTIKVATFLPASAADPVLDAVTAAGAGRIGNYTHCSYRSEGFGSFFAGAGTAPSTGASGKLNLEAEVRIEFPAPRSCEAAVLAALVAAHPYEEPAYDVYDRRGDARMIGRIGRAPSGSTLAGFAERVRSALGNPPLRVAGDPERAIDRVAVLPGAGGDFVSAAASRGAELLVTGDLGHHRAREALDLGLCLIDPGHAAGERPGLQRLLAWLGELGVEVVSYLDRDPDPWR